MFPEFLMSGGAMFQILGPRFFKLLRPLLTVLIGPVVKSAVIKDCKLYFVAQIIHS